MDKLDKNYNFFSGQTQLNLLSLMATLSQFQRTIECSPQLIEANYQEYTKFQSQVWAGCFSFQFHYQSSTIVVAIITIIVAPKASRPIPMG